MMAPILNILIFTSVLVHEVCMEIPNLKNISRLKRQGPFETNTTDVSTTPYDPNDPCIPYEPQKPNFEAPGRRISESKCYQYIWEIQTTEEQNKRENQCEIERIQNETSNSVYFVIGGRITDPGEFPHMGAIGWKAAVGTWVFKCGSTLISSKFMLTAAHCSRVSTKDTSVASPTPEIVRLGDKNIIDVYANNLFPEDKEILRIIVHPQYKSPKKYFDIAIIELKEVVTFDKYIRPACLWAQHDTSPLKNKAIVTGWGVVESAGLVISPELQAAAVDIIEQENCGQLLRSACNRLWCGIQDNQICAGKLAGGVDACQGDSGGPLQVKINLPPNMQGAMHQVIGVTSFGIGCARSNTPGIYTRVSSFIDWIEDVVWRGIA